MHNNSLYVLTYWPVPVTREWTTQNSSRWSNYLEPTIIIYLLCYSVDRKFLWTSSTQCVTVPVPQISTVLYLHGFNTSDMMVDPNIQPKLETFDLTNIRHRTMKWEQCSFILTRHCNAVFRSVYSKLHTPLKIYTTRPLIHTMKTIWTDIKTWK